MAQTITSALAATFPWVASAPDLTLTFPTSVPPSGLPLTVDVVVPSGDYRVLLAPAASDFLQVAEAEINAAMSAAGRPETFTLRLGAAGRAVLVLSTGTFSATLGPLLRALGWDAQPIAVKSSLAAYSPKHIAYFVSRMSKGWATRTAMVGAVDARGVGYSWNSGLSHASDECVFEFLPSTPDYAASLATNATPWEPAPADLGSLGSHNVPWSVADLMIDASGTLCALARGNLQQLIASTSNGERYDLVSVEPSDLAAPRAELQHAPWIAYTRFTVGLLRRAETPTGTRA